MIIDNRTSPEQKIRSAVDRRKSKVLFQYQPGLFKDRRKQSERRGK